MEGVDAKHVAVPGDRPVRKLTFEGQTEPSENVQEADNSDEGSEEQVLEFDSFASLRIGASGLRGRPALPPARSLRGVRFGAAGNYAFERGTADARRQTVCARSALCEGEIPAGRRTGGRAGVGGQRDAAR